MNDIACDEAWMRSEKRCSRIVAWTCGTMVTVNLLLVILW